MQARLNTRYEYVSRLKQGVFEGRTLIKSSGRTHEQLKPGQSSSRTSPLTRPETMARPAACLLLCMVALAMVATHAE